MIVLDHVTQPSGKSNFDLIAEILASGPVTHIDVAAAYVTHGGARDLLDLLQDSLGARWTTVRKRWLVAFDYCRTDPTATSMLAAAPASTIRIHDGAAVVARRCNPARPFHPKTFIFRGGARQAVFAGSGNVSRSGLHTGHEVGLLFDCRPPINARDAIAQIQINAVQDWYNNTWGAASPLSPSLMDAYRQIFNSVENLRRPPPTDDDPAPAAVGRSQLSLSDLRKLRACNHFWIDAGNITKNLGRSRPGNQLMMKRLSRVYFGVPATEVPQNSPLRHVRISYDNVPKDDCSLTFSDNGMDKLTLPIPRDGGPDSYDGQSLLFERLDARTFTLRLGSAAQRQTWINRSDAISAHFAMPPHNRQWGVF